MESQIRLTSEEVQLLRKLFRESFFPGDHLWLFGSRTDPNAKGGDIDLYVETLCTNPSQIVEAKTKFISQLYLALGEQKIDIVIKFANYDLPIYRVAREQGVLLV